MGYAVQSLKPTTGTWTATPTGFSADPTFSVGYVKFPFFCNCYVTTTANGTSNATTFTITLPFTSANTTTQNLILAAYHNNNANASIVGRITVAANSNIATLYINQSLGAWTGGSTTKGASFSFGYHTLV